MIGRGDIWWADLPEPVGSEPGDRRPAVVVQTDYLNVSRIRTTLVVLLTSNLDLADAPGNVRIPARSTGLPRDSVANVTQLLTVERSRLTDYIGRVPPAKLRQIDAGLRLVLDL